MSCFVFFVNYCLYLYRNYCFVMKSFSCACLFIVMSLSLVGCSVRDNEPLGELAYGWQCQFSSDTSYVFFEERFGGCGWLFTEAPDSTADFSDYSHIVVVCENVDPAITKMSINVKYAGTEEMSWALAPVVNGKIVLTVDLNPDYSEKVSTVQLMSNRRGGMNLVSANLRIPIKYRPPVKLSISNGLISADQFSGFSDSAKVEFVYAVEGEMTGVDDDGNVVPTNNWSIGIICSYGDIMGEKLPPRYIPLTGTGVQKYSCFLGDLRYMLSARDDEGECGIYWNIWRVGNITDARIRAALIREPKPHFYKED